MWQTILDLFTYPGKALDRLLAEKNYVKSNRIFFLTMVIISLSSVLTLYLLQYKTTNPLPWLITLVAIGPIGGLLFTRFLFRHLVQLGLFMAASGALPQERQERKQKASELYLLYPYHVVSLIVPAVVLPFVAAPTGNDTGHLLARLVLMIGYLLLSWATVAFQIAIMVMVVKRVYGVTTGQAFWGPMLAYFLFALVLLFVAAVFFLLLYLSHRLLR